MLYTTVKDLKDEVSKYPDNMKIMIGSSGGACSNMVIERRDIVHDDNSYDEVVAIYHSNGGCFGEEPYTDDYYIAERDDFLIGYFGCDKEITTIHGDYRLYWNEGRPNETCYGREYDQRVIEQMVDDGLLEYFDQRNSITGIRVTEKAADEYERVMEERNSA